MNSIFMHTAAEFKTYLQIRGYQIKTIHTYHLAVYECLEYMSEVKKLTSLSEITPSHLDQYYHNYLATRENRKKAGGLSQQYLSHHVCGLKLFFSYAHISQIISRDPFGGLSFPRQQRVETIVLTQDQVKKMYDQAGNMFLRILLHLAYACGLRRSEILGLLMEDVDIENRVLFIRHGKNNKQRYVPFGHNIAQDFLNYRKIRNPNTGVKSFLVDSNGESVDGAHLVKLVKDLGKKVGINQNITLHLFRHCISTHLLQNGMNSEFVKSFLGHSSLDTTLHYLHLNRKKIL